MLAAFIVAIVYVGVMTASSYAVLMLGVLSLGLGATLVVMADLLAKLGTKNEVSEALLSHINKRLHAIITDAVNGAGTFPDEIGLSETDTKDDTVH